MENKEIDEFVRTNVLKGLSEAGIPQEMLSNSMTIPKNTIKKLWRPNNYRRQIQVKEKTDSAIKYIRTTIPTIGYSQHTKILTAVIDGVTIQYFRNALVGIWEQPKPKRWTLIERNTIKEIDELLESKKEEIRNIIDSALMKFTSQFNLSIKGNEPIWLRSENAIKNDSFLDSLPRDMIIYDTIFKKVGDNDYGVEFITKKGEDPLVYTKNFITARAIEDISPMIAESINNMGNNTEQKLDTFINTLDKLNTSIGWLDKNIISHSVVLEKMNNNQDKTLEVLNNINKSISEGNRNISSVSHTLNITPQKYAKPIPFFYAECEKCNHKGKSTTKDRTRYWCPKCKHITRLA